MLFRVSLRVVLEDPAVNNLQDIVAKTDEIREFMTEGEHDYFLWSKEKSYHEKANLHMFIEDIEHLQQDGARCTT